MEYKEFTDKMIKDLKLEFDEVEMDGKDRIYVTKGVTNVSVPIKPAYKEFKMVGYNNNLKNYIKIIRDILDTYKFKLDLNNVFPLIKQKTYEKSIDKNFITKDLFCDLQVMYASDMGEVFRFVLEEDLINSGISLNALEEKSMNNLNKMTNILARLDDSLEIYSLKFITDYGASLFLSKHMQQQIFNKLGKDILLCMPSASTLLCAKYRETTFKTYTYILKQLITVDNDVNKISNNIYRRDTKGEYLIIA
ncbi:DUF1444 family protein [Paratissierella segnis]|uniref:DUF1444 family protein n=1 Tax=Paratissierella segnis TaxID=2763679 RepID=A0A926ETC3_9FIRM|nr:DUF1444 family protein [Paratissierella segnis]MBC8587102.1 DUF1444 family protein [Paratissierella segnis]